MEPVGLLRNECQQIFDQEALAKSDFEHAFFIVLDFVKILEEKNWQLNRIFEMISFGQT